MSIKYDKAVAEKLRDAFFQYSKEIDVIAKEFSDILNAKNSWSDDKRRLFNACLQVIQRNLSDLAMVQSEFATNYSQKIKELE